MAHGHVCVCVAVWVGVHVHRTQERENLLVQIGPAHSPGKICWSRGGDKILLPQNCARVSTLQIRLSISHFSVLTDTLHGFLSLCLAHECLALSSVIFQNECAPRLLVVIQNVRRNTLRVGAELFGVYIRPRPSLCMWQCNEERKRKERAEWGDQLSGQRKKLPRAPSP